MLLIGTKKSSALELTSPFSIFPVGHFSCNEMNRHKTNWTMLSMGTNKKEEGYFSFPHGIVDASALLKGFHVAHVLGWLMDLQIVNGIEGMKAYYFYILCDFDQLEVYFRCIFHV